MADPTCAPMTFAQLQAAQAAWARRNFGDAPPWQPLPGVVEEVGELAHANLKGIQGIRHTPEEIAAMKQDAVGDIVIYLCDYCTREDIDLQDAVERTWRTVSARNWKEHPLDAGDRDQQSEGDDATHREHQR